MHDPLLILAVGILFVVGGIIGLRLHAFLALLLGAFVVAILTPDALIMIYAAGKGMNPQASQALADTEVGIRIAREFGNTCGKIGILIAMASIIGKTLLESGGAEKIVRSTLKVSGIGKAPITFLGSSFFIGIPVFFDTVFYLMVPLAKAMAMKIGKNYLLLILAITAGAAMANSLVPPTPGPLFLISELDIPIGMMMVAGTLVGLVTIVVGYAYAKWANNRWPIPLRDSLDAPLESIKKLASQDEKQLPPLWMAVLPILIPIGLITLRAIFGEAIEASKTSSQFQFSQIFLGFIDFFGEKNLALIGGAVAGLIMLIFQKRGDKDALYTSVQNALMSAGVIILITS
ncbi:MAG: GntP family permease, partial [Saprospiraceae bacterium]|nr:GntP family permease [Saprospiraceae bacterium]